MKRLSRAYLVGICLQIICQNALACVLTLSASTHFSPHQIQNSNDTWTGASIDLARLLTERAGCELVIVSVPWSRAIKLLELGEIQLLTNFSMNQERQEYAEFLGPHYVENAAFIARKTVSEQVTSVAVLSLFKGPIGITRGIHFGREFEQRVLLDPKVNRKLVYLIDIVNRYSMLEKRRLDGAFDDELSASYTLASEVIASNEFSIRFTLPENPVYFGISKQSVPLELRQKLNRAWLDMLSEKVIESVYHKYGLTIDSQLFASYPLKLLDVQQP